MQDFKGVKGLEYAGAGTIEALAKIILNGEEVRLTGTIEDGQVLMRILDVGVHYWTNRTPGTPVGVDLSGKVDKVVGKGLSEEDFTTVLKNLLIAQSGTNTGDETNATILAKLGKNAIYSQTEANNLFVLKVAGKSLILDTEIARLALIRQNVYKIDLPAGASIEDRLLTAVLPAGWTPLPTGDTGKNLQIVHPLAGRGIANVNVKVIDPITGTRMLTPYRDAYSGINEVGTTLTIEGLAPNNDLPLILILIFE